MINLAETPTKIRLSQEQLVQKYEYERQKFMAFEQKRENLIGLLTETEGALAAVKAIENSSDGEKVLIPLGAGAYINATVDDKKNIQTSYAGNVFIKSSIEDTKKDLEERSTALKNNLENLAKEEQRALQNISSIEQLLRQMQPKQNPETKE